jgi:hypothetical protein
MNEKHDITEIDIKAVEDYQHDYLSISNDMLASIIKDFVKRRHGMAVSKIEERQDRLMVQLEPL